MIRAFLCLCAFSASVLQQPTFSTRIDAVRVDVLVTDDGRPVRGLRASDFEIADNGVAQQVDLVSFERVPLNVVFALDMSDSVSGERLDHLRSAGAAVLNGLASEDQAALVTFSHAVQLGAPLSKDVAAVRAALQSAAGAGETSLVDGVFAAMMVGERDAGRSLLIVFSDGVDTTSWLTSRAVLDVAKRSDIVAYAVSTARARAEFLRDLASATGGSLIEVEKTANLSAAFLRILEEFRHRYLVSYTPRGVAKDGWHRLDVRVKRRGTVRARPGYLAGR